MGTRSTQREVYVHTPLSDPPDRSVNVQIWRSYTQIWRSWLQVGTKTPLRVQLKWGAICALAVTVAIGAGFWTAVGFLVARLWK
jgi:hypothetical protein